MGACHCLAWLVERVLQGVCTGVCAGLGSCQGRAVLLHHCKKWAGSQTPRSDVTAPRMQAPAHLAQALSAATLHASLDGVQAQLRVLQVAPALGCLQRGQQARCH